MLKLLLVIPTVFAYYSVHYAENTQNALILDKPLAFAQEPSALHIADIYARLSGAAPLLHADSVAMPAVEGPRAQPAILEVTGGALPAGLSKEVISTMNAALANLPTAEQVVATLKEQGINVDYTSMEGTEMNLAAIEAWIASHSPAVILHRDVEGGPIVHRRLQDTNSTNSTRELTEEEISSYQIALWVSVAFVLMLFSGVCLITGMDVQPDSLLYAKFQSGRTNKMD